MDVKANDEKHKNIVIELTAEILKGFAAGNRVVNLHRLYPCQCDIYTGLVTWEIVSHGHVHVIPNQRHLEKPERDINEALRTAALNALLIHMRDLNDPLINRLLDKQHIDLATGKHLSETGARMLLAKILLEIKPPHSLMTKMGLLSSRQRSAIQDAIHHAVTKKGAGIEDIKTFANVSAIWNQIAETLKLPEQKQGIKSTLR